MNAPPPPSAKGRSTDTRSCANTRLAVPECSCLDCLERLIRTHAPDIFGSRPQPRS